MICCQITLAFYILFAVSANADWLTLSGNNQRTGFINAEIKSPFKVDWVRHFANERLSTAIEPIVAEGKLFTATHAGRIHAIDAQTGQWIWTFQAKGAFLHSPAYSNGIVVSSSIDGYLYANDSSNGNLIWSYFLGQGGASASPMIEKNRVFIGTRRGDFLAINIENGKLLWQKSFNVPIRQTASYYKGMIYFTAEDMVLRCLNEQTGELLWASEHLTGQTAKDYYPVIAEFDDQAFVIVRTNPTVNMGHLLGRDRHFICQSAGVDDSGWQQLDEWTKKPEALGNPEAWEKEQTSIKKYLNENPESRTFFVFEAKTGRHSGFAPVLWCAGCQSCGVPPVVMPDGRLLVYYRSVYGNWTLGVAPLVSLGLLNLKDMKIEPLKHIHGMQPPWNTFWGTADETQHFLVIGKTILIIHQSTLSGFDMETGELFNIAGDRDSWGGFRNLPWARNEWNGPGRGGVAVAGNRLYWITGSRIICIVSGEEGKNANDIEIDIQTQNPSIDQPDPSELKDSLMEVVSEFLSKRWAPYMFEPGLADRDFAFENSSSVFEAISLAYPYLNDEWQNKAKIFLANEWELHPPYTVNSLYDPNEGSRREYYANPEYGIKTSYISNMPHPFIGMYSVKTYAEKCVEWQRVLSAWSELKICFEDFLKSAWKLSDEKGDIYANRYLASLLAYVEIAEKAGDKASSAQAKKMLEENIISLIKWWKYSSKNMNLKVTKDILEWDKFIGEGNTLFFRIFPHRSKIALFHGITPEVAEIILSNLSDEVNIIWSAFEALCPTWYLSGEERQVHYGENFSDLADFGTDAFKALAWLKKEQKARLSSFLDLPLCHADLYYITRIAIILESNTQE